MIKLFSHKDIDKDKYTFCLQQAVNYRVYAELWFLSIVSPAGFDVLVLNDYEAVMPIPYQKKWGFKFVSQPPFCQQLGIFYQEKISPEDFSLFFSYLKKYRVRSYSFNEENTEYFPPNEKKRTNQVLPLQPTYTELYSHFNPNKKREIKKIAHPDFTIETSLPSADFYELLKHETIYSTSETIIRKLINESSKHNQIYAVSVKKETEMLGCIIFLLSKKRIINLISIRNKKTPELGVIPSIFNHIINEFSGSDKILDFEGSMIPGIAWFNQSFGAITQHYVTYKNFNWFERLKKYK